MANYYPLIANSAAQQIQELPAGDDLNLTSSNIVNAETITANSLIANANVRTDNLLYANGQPWVFGSTYSNADVANYLPTYTGNLVSLTGDITTTGNITAGNVLGNIATTGNIAVGNLLTDNLLYANGTPWAFGSGTNYGDANVANYLPTYAGNLSPGNLTVANDAVITGNLRVLGNTTFIDANTLVVGDLDIVVANNAATASDANGAGILVGSTGQYASLIWRYGGNLWDFSGNVAADYLFGDEIEATSNLRVTGIGNITSLEASNVRTDSLLYANGNPWSFGTSIYGNSNVANYLASNSNVEITAGASNITTQGNITGGYVLGNGYFLSGISGGGSTYGNSNVADFLASNSNVVITTTGNVTSGNLTITSASGNANSVLRSTGQAIILENLLIANSNAAVNGNISANYFIGNGSLLTGISGGTGDYSNANVANYLPTYTGNIGGGNIDISGNIGADYITALGDISANSYIGNGRFLEGLDENVANILNGNLDIQIQVGVANITTQGNISGGYVLGNGYFLSGISGGAGYSNADVANYLPTYAGNLVSLTGNITTTANISGDYLLGNIRFATGGYGNAEVSNYLASNSNIAITTTGTLQSNNIVTTGTGVSTIVSGSDINLNCNNGAGQVNVTGSLYANAGIFGNNVMAFQSTVSNANADTGTWITVVINGQKFDLIARANTA